MSNPTHEQLLGYVLGALDRREHDEIERLVAQRPELADQVARIASCLSPLESCRATPAPPSGLVQRTCSWVFEHLAEPQPEAVDAFPSPTPAAMGPRYEYAEAARGWTLADMVVAAGIFLAAGMLFFPAIANSRYHAQLAQCQNNLRLLGEALIGYSRQNGQNEFPHVPGSGNRSFAGYQAAVLLDEGYLDRNTVVLCPSSSLASRRNDWQLPRPSAYDQAEGAVLRELQRLTGGSFAWPLGYLQAGELRAPRNRSRENFALVADAPSGTLPNMVSTHHDGKGQNTLFEDGHIAYVCGCGIDECGDSMFWNENLKIQPGLHENDDVLAASGTLILIDFNVFP